MTALLEQVGLLRTIKEKISPLDAGRTPTARAKALKDVEDKAAALRSSIEALEFHERMRLDDEFFGEEALLDERYSANALDLAGSIVPRIEGAALSMRSRYEGNAGKAGRPNLSARQIESIECIAVVLAQVGIWPARTGKFLDLCEGVHQAAGVTWPARAFSAFLKDFRAECARWSSARGAPTATPHGGERIRAGAKDEAPVPSKPNAARASKAKKAPAERAKPGPGQARAADTAPAPAPTSAALDALTFDPAALEARKAPPSPPGATRQSAFAVAMAELNPKVFPKT